MQFVVGIDEAGRGPLAGPVAIGLVAVPKDFDWDTIPGVTDSKKLGQKKRAVIFEQAKFLKDQGRLNFIVMLISAKEIDEKGIAVVIREGIETGLEKLSLSPAECFIKLDGSLKAPPLYPQETIIRGDAKEQVIGLASVCAKETRDLYMLEIASQFPSYDFAIHKGYGTKNHRQKIALHGLSSEHRVSYCKNSLNWATV